MKLIVVYTAVVLSYLQVAAGEPVLQGKKTGHIADFDKNNQKNVIGREKYPYIVYLEIYDRINNEDNFCGGTIIRKRVVLTAAHCFSVTSGDIGVHAVAGILHLNVERKRAQVVKMYDYLIHEKYARFGFTKDKQGEAHVTQFENDIALVWLVHHFEYNAKVNQIPLMSPNTRIVDKEGFILGWGQTEKGSFANMLRSADLKVIRRSECEYTEKGKHYITDQGMLCTISDNQRSQPFSGDSGGPFVVDNKLAGVISNSFKLEVTPPHRKKGEISVVKRGGIVTNVAFYDKWILDNIKQGPPRDRKNRQKKPLNQQNPKKAGNISH